MYKGKVVAVVIPAHNEENAIGDIVSQLLDLYEFDSARIIDEVVVCDNNSSDNTAKMAAKAGARVVSQTQAGYGIACLTAIENLNQPDIVLFIDGDRAFYERQCLSLLEPIAAGADLVIGSRELGTIESGALTTPQRFGNWLASKMVYLLWSYNITDLGPYRAISSRALQQLNMIDEKYGWTVEMQVKAIQHNMHIVEVPVDTRKRIGVSKISGTVRGSIGAAHGIIGTILKLRWKQLFHKPMGRNQRERKPLIGNNRHHKIFSVTPKTH